MEQKSKQNLSLEEKKLDRIMIGDLAAEFVIALRNRIGSDSYYVLRDQMGLSFKDASSEAKTELFKIIGLCPSSCALLERSKREFVRFYEQVGMIVAWTMYNSISPSGRATKDYTDFQKILRAAYYKAGSKTEKTMLSDILKVDFEDGDYFASRFADIVFRLKGRFSLKSVNYIKLMTDLYFWDATNSSRESWALTIFCMPAEKKEETSNQPTTKEKESTSL